MYKLEGNFGNASDARVSISSSFVTPKFDQSLILRFRNSGGEDGPLKVTLESTIIQPNPTSKSSLTIDDITLYLVPGTSESDHLSSELGIQNDIVIQFRGIRKWHGHLLHDIELLDEAGLEDHHPRNQELQTFIEPDT